MSKLEEIKKRAHEAGGVITGREVQWLIDELDRMIMEKDVLRHPHKQLADYAVRFGEQHLNNLFPEPGWLDDALRLLVEMGKQSRRVIGLSLKVN